jgi:hypothetical protein
MEVDRDTASLLCKDDDDDDDDDDIMRNVRWSNGVNSGCMKVGNVLISVFWNVRLLSSVGRYQMFRRNLLPSYSGQKNEIVTRRYHTYRHNFFLRERVSHKISLRTEPLSGSVVG